MSDNSEIPVITAKFEGHPINFRPSDAFVNLTTMCKPFEQRPYEFLRLPSTRAFIQALETDLNTGLRENPVGVKKELRENPIVLQTAGNPVSLVFTTEGRDASTWAHPDIALECARWLSPVFSIWCNRTIRRILSGELIVTQQPEQPAWLAIPDEEEPQWCPLPEFAQSNWLAKSWLMSQHVRFAKNCERLAQIWGVEVQRGPCGRWGNVVRYPSAFLLAVAKMQAAPQISALQSEQPEVLKMLTVLPRKEWITFSELCKAVQSAGLFSSTLGSSPELSASEMSAFGKILKRWTGRMRTIEGRSLTLLCKGRQRHRRYMVEEEAAA